MRTFSLLAYGLCAGLAGGGPGFALDASRPQSGAAAVTIPVPGPSFKSERDAFRSGIRNYNSGDKAGAVRALEYAATKGHSPALWKLGRMYADGDGVAHDDLKAFEYFSRIADAHADDGPDSPNARFVSNAFVVLGGYFVDGIPNTYVKPNVARAREMFQYAASFYGDADAQYNLARLYLDGQGGAKDSRTAARWLNLAAEKGHAPSQALLGHLLVNGQGVPRQAARGLMWLTLARDAADPQKEGWIVEMHDKAFAQVSDNDRQVALIYLEQHMQR
ncbi:tetratricopeptide repeat protein [Chelatococcus reniformis]|uniref:Exopolysaccharide biosynthesis protein n=1 Tax=Chelatococcus reniformis TaxID=1494448 RepID=A0A916U0A3_9HYPH|nr:tetratricopeptide repeat protein [Chelatococcus reniformis]GGC55292.1 hypothetical protein GCM10010994_12720 [Chelatococcus reniformis]